MKFHSNGDDMKEIWVNIKDFPGYQVSTRGLIRTRNKTTYTKKHGVRTWKDRTIKQVFLPNGYKVTLWKDGKPYYILVHRLVANELIDQKIDSDLTVNHKDGNRRNNNFLNLEWMTRVDNIRHGFKTGLYKTRKCRIVSDSGEKMEFKSMRDADRYLGRSTGYSYNCVHKGRKATAVSGEKYTFEF